MRLVAVPILAAILCGCGSGPLPEVPKPGPLPNIAALHPGPDAAARLLLQNHADVNQRWCVQFETRDFKQVRSKNPACSLTNGVTPLMWSASTDRAEAVALLLEFNADRSLKDWAGRSALDYARTDEIRTLLTTRR